MAARGGLIGMPLINESPRKAIWERSGGARKGREKGARFPPGGSGEHLPSMFGD